jgi:hypothetical protein
MPRMICYAQAKRRKTAKGKASTHRSGGGSVSDSSVTYTILDRVPMYLSEHTEIWDAIFTLGQRQLIIDEEHPDDAFHATVLQTESINGDALASIESTLSEVRDRFLDAEKAVREKNEVLGKPLDSLYSEQKEWLGIRMLLANAIVRSSATKTRVKKARVKKAKKNRAILLIDA